MTTVVRRAVLAGILGLFIGCSDSAQFNGPTLTPPAATPTALPPPPSHPPLSGSTTTYQFSEPLSYRVSSWTERSSVVLYETGAFSLAYDDFSFPGAYQREGNRITFAFSGWADDRGAAIGTLTDGGDLLEVSFSDWMQHSDFENAVYRWVK